jgi:hypothetical protein
MRYPKTSPCQESAPSPATFRYTLPSQEPIRPHPAPRGVESDVAQIHVAQCPGAHPIAALEDQSLEPACAFFTVSPGDTDRKHIPDY